MVTAIKRIAGRFVSAPRRVRVAIAGYLVVALFVLGAGVALLAHVDRTLAVAVGLLLAAPILLALIGDRITGFKAFSVEVSLAEVAVAVEGDFSGAVMAIAETGPSASPDLLVWSATMPRGSVPRRIKHRRLEPWHGWAAEQDRSRLGKALPRSASTAAAIEASNHLYSQATDWAAERPRQGGQGRKRRLPGRARQVCGP